MDVSIDRLTRRFNGIFSPQQAIVLAEAIHDSYASQHDIVLEERLVSWQ